MNLVIVESPTKSKTLQKFLGEKYSILSSYGHIRDLPKGELGVDTEKDFQPKYVIPAKARKTVNLLKKEAAKAETVFLACDQDREGEAIAWHLTQALELKEENYRRITFQEITETAIKESLKNPRAIDINLVNAQQARRILDRLVGYKLSPFLWKKIARGLSAGRVQSVTVKLVCQREEEINKFNPEEYWQITALLRKEKEKFEAFLIKREDQVIPKLGIKNEKEANEIIQGLKKADYRVTNSEKKEVQRNPLPPFTTSTLQQTAWQKFRFSAKATMRTAQQLYEKGLITYHRTDSLNLSDFSLAVAKKFIVENYGEQYWAGFFKRYKTKTKKAQEAHEAIRPSYPDKKPESLQLDKNQGKLYDLIWRRFIACQMSQAIFNSQSIDIEAANCLFRATGQTLKFEGFLKVYPLKFKEKELPSLEEKDLLELIELVPSQHFTQPPARYTEATLVKVLEENGIGRPSTYAPVLSNIQEKNYIEKNEEKRFRPTEIGQAVNKVLSDHFPEIVDVNFTAKIEEELDEVAQGQKKWKETVRNFYQPFEKNLEKKYQEVSKKEFTEETTEKTCPKCGAKLLIRLGKYGKFYACSAFPKCKYTESIKKPGPSIKCPKCQKGEVTEKRTKKGKIFYGCNQFPKCDFALWDKPTGEICPQCQSLLVQKKGKVSCSNKNCDYSKKVEK